MAAETEIRHIARTLPKSERKSIISSFKETKLHDHLKRLFSEMETDYLIEVTHGSSELGKDLVIVKRDSLSTDVIAVVVKKGDVKGKTLGDVDGLKAKLNCIYSYSENQRLAEVESQIDQALKNEAELASVFDRLPVTKVIVILAGEISSAARKRIESEISAITIHDINWLIDNFTEFYPQVFFEAKAIDFLQDQIGRLESTNWLAKSKPKSLSEYYVDPLIKEVEATLTATKTGISLRKSNEFNFSELANKSKSHRKIIISGDPGSGKSIALSKLAIDLYRNAYSQTAQTSKKTKAITIPVLVAAKELLEITNDTDLKTVCSLTPEVEDKFDVNLLMVDALDEAPPSHREEVLEKAQSCCSSLNCSLIVTSRKVDCIEKPPKGYKKYELLPFDLGQALSLFRKIVENETSLNVLKESLEQIKFQIPMVPLSLMLLVDIVEERKEIPSSVTELYDRFFDLSLGRWDRDKGIEVLFEYLIKKRFLAKLAFRKFMEQDRIEIDRVDFDGFLAEYAKVYGWDKEQLGDFIREIERAGIISRKSTVLFRHRSFLDYFAAFYIYDNREKIDDIETYIVNLYFKNLWREVAFYYIGLKREIDKSLIHNIINYSNGNKELLSLKTLVGRLLQAGWHSTEEARVYGIRVTLDLISELRDSIVASFETEQGKIPKIIGDIMVLGIADFAYDSAFLIRDEKKLFKHIKGEAGEEDLYKLLFLLWCMKRLLPEEERKEFVSQVYDLITDLSEKLADEYRARLFLILTILKIGDPKIQKKIRAKLKRLLNRSPNIIEALLPPPKKGFR